MANTPCLTTIYLKYLSKKVKYSLLENQLPFQAIPGVQLLHIYILP